MQRDEGGQAMVEFALVLPVILLLLFGMLQLGLVLNARQTVAYAAQAAANGYAQTLERRTADARAAEAAEALRPRLPGSGAVRYTIFRGGQELGITSDGTGAFGDLVAARVNYGFPSPIRAGIGPFRFPDTFTLSAEAVARIEATGSVDPGGAAAGAAPVQPSSPPPTGPPTPSPTPTPTSTSAPTPSPTATASPTPTPSPTATPRPADCLVFAGVIGPSTLKNTEIDRTQARLGLTVGPGSHAVVHYFSKRVGFGSSRSQQVSYSIWLTRPQIGATVTTSQAMYVFGRYEQVTLRFTGIAGGSCARG